MSLFSVDRTVHEAFKSWSDPKLHSFQLFQHACHWALTCMLQIFFGYQLILKSIGNRKLHGIWPLSFNLMFDVMWQGMHFSQLLLTRIIVHQIMFCSTNNTCDLIPSTNYYKTHDNKVIIKANTNGYLRVCVSFLKHNMWTKLLILNLIIGR
jgi:hypothetical protein